METVRRRRHLTAARLLPLLLAALLVGGLTGAAPADAASWVRVSSLTGPTRVDRVVISRVGIDLPVKAALATTKPKEGIAYHYPGTSWPGGGSNTYLYGHARTGSFLALWSVQKGDIVKLHLTKGGWVRYKVTQVRRVRWDDLRWLAHTHSERLTLQTCVSYTEKADRFVVIAVPVA